VVLYPNPANDQVRIQANNNIVELRVLDAFGRMITTIANAGMITTLSTQHMADGVYHITINTADGNAHQTLVVRH
jgi:TRAP-type mannitol/chloroaromatic compound transport system substrate-binding protein